MISNPLKSLEILAGLDTVELWNSLPDSVLTLFIVTRASAVFNSGKPDSGVRLMQYYREKSRKNQKEWVIAIADLWFAETYNDLGNNYLAAKYIEEAVPILEKNKDDFQLARAYNIHGSLLRNIGKLSESQKLLMKSLKLFEHLNKKRAIGAVYINLGNNYADLNDFAKALDCYRKAESISFNDGDTVNYLTVLNSFSQLYHERNTDSSYHYAEKVIKVKGSGRWLIDVLPARFSIADVAYERKDFKTALQIFQQILDTCIRDSIRIGIYMSYSGIGNVYEALGEDKKALDFFRTGTRLALNNHDYLNAVGLLKGVLYMQKKSGDFKSAMETVETIKNLNDSVKSIEKQVTVHDLELMYNNEKTERINSELNSKMDTMRRQISYNHLFLTVTAIFIMILSGLLFYIYRLYRQRDVAYRTLIEKYRNDIQLFGESEALPEFTEPPPVAETETTAKEINDNYHYSRLLQYFDYEKPYLNPDLKIQDVADAVNLNRKILTTILLSNTGMHFIGFVNNYRVREALRLLSSPDYQNIKIEHIAKEAGFGSKVSFYTAFTQVTGYKPSSYREKN